MKDLFGDLSDVFSSPVWWFVLLPLLLLACPSAHGGRDFPVHRLAHFDLSSGAVVGSKVASVAMDARHRDAAHVFRKIVVVRIKDMSVGQYSDLASKGCGGLLLLVPPKDAVLTPEEKETIFNFEEHLLTSEVAMAVYYAHETQELLQLLDDLKEDESLQGKRPSAAKELWDSLVSDGYQLVTAAGNPKQLAEHGIVTLQGGLRGLGDEDALPTIILSAHYDASGAAPSLSLGADSNGSGVTILLELARMWSLLYKSTKSRPAFNVVFLLTGGGKMNFIGTKKWLDEQKEDQSSELLGNAKMAICLDSLGLGDNINMHVSKPPKEGTMAHKFLTTLQNMAKKLYKDAKINLVHKKINLADDYLAWEHERFSIHKLSAFTLSHYENARAPERDSILDRTVDEGVIKRNVKLIAETMACLMYNLEGDNCIGSIMTGVSSPSDSAISMWTSEMSARPRAASLLVTKPKSSKNRPRTIEVLSDTLDTYAGPITEHYVKREKREAEYTFYDVSETTMHAYRVKHAAFDFVLMVLTSIYLAVVYKLTKESSKLVAFWASLTSAGLSGKTKVAETNGFSNGHKVKTH